MNLTISPVSHDNIVGEFDFDQHRFIENPIYGYQMVEIPSSKLSPTNKALFYRLDITNRISITTLEASYSKNDKKCLKLPDRRYLDIKDYSTYFFILMQTNKIF